uniref:Uncharacterized protein n=1 Tax=Solanum lycopersicum TaxID=4081 RepID=A0A3Q7HQ30_SOLLC
MEPTAQRRVSPYRIVRKTFAASLRAKSVERSALLRRFWFGFFADGLVSPCSFFHAMVLSLRLVTLESEERKC